MTVSADGFVRELTPPGRGGVSVLELRGEAAIARLRELLERDLPPVGRPSVVRLAAGEIWIDEALVLVHADDWIELHVHGSPPLIARLTQALGGGPAPLPESLEQRAAARLAHAPSEAAARILLAQSEGALRRELEALGREDGAAFEQRLDALLERARIARRLIEPPVVVLSGPVNAGKSTLFNALVGRERVVVSAREGTTRDAIVERVRLGGWLIDLVDVAGERALEVASGQAAIEAAGQDLGRELAGEAALVLRLVPAVQLVTGNDEPAPAGGPLHVTVASRCDELALADAQALDPSVPRIAPRTDPAAAAELVRAVVLGALALPDEPSFDPAGAVGDWAGIGVPFDTHAVRVLEGLRDASGAFRATALAALLEPAPRA